MLYQNTVGAEEVFTEKETILEQEQSNNNSKSYIFYNIVKRVFDFVSSFLLAIVIAIPGVIVMGIIMIVDWGNPFYLHGRIGKDGKEIKILKFRSMRKHNEDLKELLMPEQYEQYLKEYKIDNDPRLLGHGVGKFIRNTSMDELPQLLNIIKGDLSVVGPRPIVYTELMEKYTPEQQRKLLSVKPGLTGYWQAYARNNVGYDSGKRQEMELYYVENRGVWMDIKILCKSVITVLKRSGAQ